MEHANRRKILHFSIRVKSLQQVFKKTGPQNLYIQKNLYIQQYYICFKNYLLRVIVVTTKHTMGNDPSFLLAGHTILALAEPQSSSLTRNWSLFC